MAKKFNIITLSLADPGGDPEKETVFKVGLENDFVVTPGVQPNVNTLILESDTFEDVTDLLYRDGKLKFYFETLPGGDDNPLVWGKLRLIDAEILEYGGVTKTPSKAQSLRTRPWRWRL